MTLNITTLYHYAVYAECHYALCQILFIVMLNVIMLSVIMLYVFMLIAILLSVVATHPRASQETMVCQLITFTSYSVYWQMAVAIGGVYIVLK
jgi:hypothetical protein